MNEILTIGELQSPLKILWHKTIMEQLEEAILGYSKKRTDDKLSLPEIQSVMNNTLDIVKKELPDLDVSHLFSMINDPMNTTRPQSLIWFIKHLRKAEVNYILEDDDGNKYYPYIVDLLLAPYLLEGELKKNKDGIQHAIKAEDLLGVRLFNSDVSTMIEFYKQVKINQLKHYAVSIFSKVFKKAYDSLKTVAKKLYFSIIGVQKNFAKKIMEAPMPFINIFKNTLKVYC
jgi:hypothetical protein